MAFPKERGTKVKKQSSLSRLLEFTGGYRKLTYLGLFLSAAAMVMGMVPYICVWLLMRDLISAAPAYSSAGNISGYGWMAFYSAVFGILIYFAALMCTHIAAFRTASNIRKKGMEHLMKVPLGFFDDMASGMIRNRLDGAAAETETLLAHNLADIVGTAAMFLSTIVLMFVFDWRMGASCLMAAVVSIAALIYMMGGKNARFMAEYQAAQDSMSKAGTEYVRGMPVVKVFQQTVYSFKNFRDAIEEYSEKAEHVQDKICKIPQSINLTAIEGAFVFMVPVVLFMAPRALSEGTFASFVTDFAFYAVFSAIISTALARIMFAANGAMLADTAMKRIETVMNAPVLLQPEETVIPEGNDIEFRHVSFTYEGSEVPAISDLSFKIRSGETVALVGPSGSGKSTCARLAARLWDINKGSIKMGGVDIASVEPETLLSDYSFVFQDVMLFDDTVMENIRLGKHGATDEEVMNAARAANCDEFVQKLPLGYNTRIGENGAKLSGGERQRISIARALLKDVPIVFLDEATASLDVENETRVQGALSRLLRNRTVLVIAHRMRTVERADKVVVLKDGHVAEEGNPAMLKKDGNSIFGHMLELQTRGAAWSI